MKIIVTGGAGFIGSNFVRYLMDEHPAYRVVCADCLSYAGHLSSLEGILQRHNFRFYRADICDKGDMNAIFAEERPDVVVNFAAESHVDRSIENPELFLKTNILGVQVLLEACLKWKTARFHQVSTDEVYGDLPPDQVDSAFTEASPLRASSPYSASKASADLLTLAYARTYRCPVTISRCSNNYGPYQHPEKLIPLTVLNAMRNRPIPIYGSGQNIRDWIYVEDHCRAIDKILHKGALGEVYNIGGGCELTNLGVARKICRILGKPESLITFVEDRRGHDLRYAISTEKMRSELNWSAKTRFSEGLQKTVEWYLENEAWWKPLYV